MLKMALICFAAAGAPVFASTQLVPLPIREIKHDRLNGGEQVVVTVDYQACKYAYKGLYLEQIASGQGQLRFQVHALATERIPGACEGPVEPRTDSLTLSPSSAERYDFVAVQPK